MEKVAQLWIGAGGFPLSSSQSTVGGEPYPSSQEHSDIIRKNYSFLSGGATGQPANISAEVDEIQGYLHSRYVVGKSPLKKSFTSSVPRTREETLNQSGGNLDKLM